MNELSRIDLFEGLSDDELAAWEVEIRDVPAGEVILQQGVDSPGLLLIFDGTVSTRQGNDPLTPNVGPT